MLTRAPIRPRTDASAVASSLFVCLGIVYVAATCLLMGRITYNVWAAVLLVPLLGGGSVLALRVLAPSHAGESLVPLLTTALVVKGLGSVARYAVSSVVYDDRADATGYHSIATVFGRQFRAGDFDVDLGTGSSSTHFMKVVTGIVYAVIGPSKAGGFLVFSVAAFWGIYLFFRAFQIAVPDGDAKRYALLVFFLPSLLFWPSSIGKEAWMTLALGLAAFGTARLFTHRRGAYPPLLLGIAATLAVRPHVAVIVAVALGASFVLRPSLKQGLRGRRLGKAFVLLALVLIGIVGAQKVNDTLNIDDTGSITRALDVAQLRTDEGGSRFEAARVRSPVDVPWAAMTVLFRPFPNEVHNAQSVISSLEGIALIVLFVGSWRRLARVPRVAPRQPYVAMCALYSLMFIIAFSTFGNFGIITRQRVQLFPFIFVLLCIPVPRTSTTRPLGGPALYELRRDDGPKVD